jgi:hypothetical protein
LKDGIFRRFINSLIRALICGIKPAVVNRLWAPAFYFRFAPGSRLGEEPVFAQISHTSLKHRWRLRIWANAGFTALRVGSFKRRVRANPLYRQESVFGIRLAADVGALKG